MFQVPGSNRKFSKIAYDALMLASSALSAGQRQLLADAPDTVRAALARMYEKDAAAFGGRKTNAVDARKRNSLALEALENALATARANNP